MEVKKKKSKPQGKINQNIVLKGLIEGKKKKDIAVEAGSLAKDDSSKINAVNRVTNSDEFQEKFNKAIPAEKLIETHKEGLEAYEERVKYYYDKKGNRKGIVRRVPDFNARHKYLATGYELTGRLKKDTPPPNTVNIFKASKMLINVPT